MTDAILQTKLHIPPLRSNLVPRPRLTDQFNAGLEGGLTLISAPAGYGKTTLVTEWLSALTPIPFAKHPCGAPEKRERGERVRAAWLSLDESDNDPRRFLDYLLAALRQIQADVGKPVEAMLQSPQPPPPEAILTALVNELSAVAQPFLLVIDDYHVIHTPPIHQQLNFLLEHQPPNMRLIIVTREDPPLPLSRLRARGQMTEIRQADLRFTPEECADFLNRVMGLNLSAEDVSALERRTEGWIAGLQLAALLMRGHEDVSGFIQAFTGSNRFILDYLMDEVFERQTPDVKDFLLKTSVLERMCGALCNAVVGNQLSVKSQAILESLEHSNLFIIPLDQSRQWYRYHHLFAELLRHRLRAFHAESEYELHRRASQWYENNNFPSDAIHHALAAQDWGRAGSLIQSANADFLKRGEVLTVLGWFQSLPEELLLSNPRLCFDYCWPLLLAGEFDVADPLLDRVEQTARDIPAFLGEVLAAQAYLARGQGDHALMVEKSQRALALLPKSSANSRGIVAMNLGLAYWHMGQMKAAEEVLAEALEAGQATGNLYAMLTALIFQGRILAVRGQLRKAAGYLERAIQQGGEMTINALAYVDLSTLHYEWNELDKSAECLQKAILLCQRGHNDEFLVGCRMFQARLLTAQGKLSEAEEALEEARALIHSRKISKAMAERVDAAQVLLLLAQGKPTAEWVQKLNERVDCHPFYRFLGVTKARVLPEAYARAYLTGLGEAAKANEWVYSLIAVRALQAALAEKQEEAMAFLTEALQLAEGGGFIRSFMEAGEKLVPLLREAARRGITPRNAKRILNGMAGKVEVTETDMWSMIEPLSEREIEVLRLVASGMSNREIAGKLVISTGTAKTHVHNVCLKLGVRNRTEAATRAKELGLV